LSTPSVSLRLEESQSYVDRAPFRIFDKLRMSPSPSRSVIISASSEEEAVESAEAQMNDAVRVDLVALDQNRAITPSRDRRRP
jgi:hypothetical protein